MPDLGKNMHLSLPGLSGNDPGAASELIHEVIMTKAKNHGERAWREGRSGFMINLSVRPLIDECFPEMNGHKRGQIMTALSWTRNLICVEKIRGRSGSRWWVSEKLTDVESVYYIAKNGRMPPGMTRPPEVPQLPVAESAANDLSMLRRILAAAEREVILQNKLDRIAEILQE
jgi:hypothetical protein